MYLRTPRLSYILFLHLAGMPAAYFLTGFLSNFYPKFHQFVLVSVLTQMVCGLFMILFFDDRLTGLIQNWRKRWISLLTFLVVFSLSITAVLISWQFPEIFNRRIIFMDVARMPLFLSTALISVLGIVILIRWLEHKGWVVWFKATSLFYFIQVHLEGVLLAAMFFFVYFVFAQTVNFPQHNTLDLNFDIDNSQWIARLTSPPTDDMPLIRAVHPAVMLFLRPLIWLLSIPLNGDRLQAALMLNALAGSACVFLAWVIVKNFSNSTYALIVASLLGGSASHLLLGSVIETYIFSALALLAFVLLLQTDRTSLDWTIPMGILIFGITITNLAQACILYFLKLSRFKLLVMFILAVVAATLLLNVVQVGLFPSAQPLYNPESLTVEKHYVINPSDAFWRLQGRINLISRAVLLYGIAAPKPFILTQELGTDFPNFRTYKITVGRVNVAGYKGMGDFVIKLWVALLAIAIILTIKNFIKSPKQEMLSLGLALCLGFNFLLHTLYGDDPMLYSPDWVYALVLLVAFSFRNWANSQWFQLALVIFVGMVIYNNLELFRQIMTVYTPLFSR